MMQARHLALAFAAAALLAAASQAAADDQLKVTIGQRGNWDTAISHLGSKVGIFKKHGLELELISRSRSRPAIRRPLSPRS